VRASYARAGHGLSSAGMARWVALPDDLFPVTWAGRRAIVSFPGQVDISNVDQLRDRLLSVINRGATVLIADMISTVSCDHAAVGQARAQHRRAGSPSTHLSPARRGNRSGKLLDRVVQHLFQVGLSPQAAADLPGETARERLGEAMDRLDEVIQEIRDYAFTAEETGDGPGLDRPGAS
jgi:hypothetical protein